MKQRWESWGEPHLVVDSAVDPPDAVLEEVLAAVPAHRTGPVGG